MRGLPKYRRHPSGQAFVYHKSIPTKDHRMYLGKFDTPESKRRYQQFIARLNADSVNEDVRLEFKGNRLNITQLLALYLQHCQRTHRADGKTTKEFACIVQAMRPVAQLFGDSIGEDFRPADLALIQDEFVRLGYSRTTVNSHLGRVKRLFKWCCRFGHLRPSLYYELKCVEGLRAGQSSARESTKKPAVGIESIKAIEAYLPPIIQSMVWTQYLCGMRPQDVTNIRPVDLDRESEIWLYRPERHKNRWRGKELIKAIPKVAQRFLLPYLNCDEDAYAYSPRELMRWNLLQKAERAAASNSGKSFPYQKRMREERLARIDSTVQRYSTKFTTELYCNKVRQAFQQAEAAGLEIERWTPNQLRHGIATSISSLLSRESAQVWLGHEHMETTEIYARKRVEDIIRVAQQMDTGQIFQLDEVSTLPFRKPLAS